MLYFLILGLIFNLIKQKYGNIDVVIATEILYADSHAKPFLICTQKLLSENGGMLIISIAVRLKELIQEFHRLTEKFGTKQKNLGHLC